MFKEPFMPVRLRYGLDMINLLVTIGNRVKELGDQLEKGNVE